MQLLAADVKVCLLYKITFIFYSSVSTFPNFSGSSHCVFHYVYQVHVILVQLMFPVGEGHSNYEIILWFNVIKTALFNISHLREN